MTRQIKRDSADDEYRFSEVGAAAPSNKIYSTIAQKVPTKFDKRKALIVVGVLIGVFLIYKLLGVVFHKQESSIATQTTQPQQVSVEAKQKATQTQAVAKVQQAQPQQNFDDQQNQQLATLAQHEKQVDNDLQNIKGRMQHLESNLQGILHQLGSQQKILFALQKSKTGATAKKKTQSHQSKLKKYFIKAAIPGRAWLISDKGDFLTVSQGSKVPDYGQVNKVDAYKGIISTTSHRLITFNEDDR